MPSTKGQRSAATSSKAKKDPNAPKRPQSSYFLFAGDMRQKLKAVNPDLKVTEVAKECGRLWKEVSDDQKKKYEALAAKEKERYQKEMEDYSKN